MKNHSLNFNSQISVARTKQRDSNLELYRIITMLLIIAHHYVVNSGLTNDNGPIYNNPMSAASIFLLTFGAFGKTGINCFVLISGYFMCKSQITAKKFTKLLGQVIFYDLLFNAIFWIAGYAPFTLETFFLGILPFTSVTQNFTGCYLLFFLCIPFLNILIKNLTQKQHLYLIVLLSFIYILMGTVPDFQVSMNYVSWFSVLYIIAAYIRLYPKKIFEKTALWGVLTLSFVFVSLVSVLVCTWYGTKTGSYSYYLFVSDSNTLLAVLTGLSSFLFFKNIKLRYCPFINTISSTTFGVLLIHAANNSMRTWLWQDVLNNIGVYTSQLMPLHAISSVLGIFVICSMIDLLRIHYIEKPLLRLWDKHCDQWRIRFLRAENNFCKKHNISTEDINTENTH